MKFLPKKPRFRGKFGAKWMLIINKRRNLVWPAPKRMLIIICPTNGICAAGAWLTVLPLADTLGFVALPPLYWPLLAIMLLGYVILTQFVKTWFYRRFSE
jgi:hypothetical protein